MKKLFIIISILSFGGGTAVYAQQTNQCWTYEQEGFTLEGRESGVEIEYECPRDARYYPYFGRLNFRTQQGLRCDSEIGITSVWLTCRNRSHSARSARSVTITCCHEQVYGL